MKRKLAAIMLFFIMGATVISNADLQNPLIAEAKSSITYINNHSLVAYVGESYNDMGGLKVKLYYDSDKPDIVKSAGRDYRLVGFNTIFQSSGDNYKYSWKGQFWDEQDNEIKVTYKGIESLVKKKSQKVVLQDKKGNTIGKINIKPRAWKNQKVNMNLNTKYSTTVGAGRSTDFYFTPKKSGKYVIIMKRPTDILDGDLYKKGDKEDSTAEWDKSSSGDELHTLVTYHCKMKAKTTYVFHVYYWGNELVDWDEAAQTPINVGIFPVNAVNVGLIDDGTVQVSKDADD